MNGIHNTKTRDGHQWTPESGLESGIPCIGAVTPSTKIPDPSALFDVIVIGAGYAGLTATRDLTLAGHKVLLVEARDRIGGRTWSSNLGGYPFEMGGTWVHWNQPFVYREISRYGLAGALENSHDFSRGCNRFVLTHSEGRKVMSRDDEAAMMDKVMKKFINVDGKFGREIMPMPADPFHNPNFVSYEKMSFADRFAQIKHELTVEEYDALEGFLSITSGGSMETSSFGEMIRWWALNNYDMQLFMEQCLTYKFNAGQSSFARKFFDEAQMTNNLCYAFDSPVRSVSDSGSKVTVVTRSGNAFAARRVICTVPLNVLNDIQFEPPLDPLKVEASRLGHVNKVSKVHVECANPELRSFSATTANPHHDLTYVFGDGTTPAGNTHLVSFGSSYAGVNLQPEQNADRTVAAMKHFVKGDMDVKRVVFHNWTGDEYAKGAWEWLRPDFMSKYLEPLRQRHGNILFGSADWASLWRGFIDGGIEDGARVAKEVQDELRQR